MDEPSDLVMELLATDEFLVGVDPLAKIENPGSWDRLPMSHRGNWKAYLPEVVQKHWRELSLEARTVAYLMAMQQVGQED